MNDEPSLSALAEEPVPEGDLLTVAEAAATYGLSVSTIRRLLSAGRLGGVTTVRGSKGNEYRIPAHALEALGYRPADTGPATVRSARAEAELARIRAELDQARADLATTRGEADLARARVQDLEAAAQDLRVALERVPEPEARRLLPTALRRWWSLVVLALVLFAALFLRAGCVRVTTVGRDQPQAAPSTATPSVATAVTTTPSVTTAAVTAVPASTSPPSTAPPVTTTVAPATTASTTAATSTTVAPTTLPAVAPTTPLASDRDAFALIAFSVNEEFRAIELRYPVLEWQSARAHCNRLELAYVSLATWLSTTEWSTEVAPLTNELAAAAQAVADELHHCHAVSTGGEALLVLKSPHMRDLLQRVGEASTALRLALGLPVVWGEPGPLREV